MLCFILSACPGGGIRIVFRIGARRLAAIWLDSLVNSFSCEIGGFPEFRHRPGEPGA
jgi:hypothetical protein